MKTDRIVQSVALLVTLGALVVAGLVVTPKVNQERKVLQLGFARTDAEAVPPSIAFASSMMGPLKGFVVNVLWYQVEDLKQKGQFAQINELCRTITTLQPRFPEVWRFQAWNMAYNVSVQTFTPQERWDWVRKGIRLIRDEGLIYNPRAVRLYREISWIYFHKIGQVSDDSHWYYKSEHCREWQELVGVIGESVETPEAIAQFKRIVDAPDTLEALISAQPEVRKLLDTYFTPAGYDVESGFKEARIAERERMLRAVGKIIMYNYASKLEELPFDLRPQPQYYDSKLLPMFKESANRAPLEALLSYLRKRVITDSYHMDPVEMLEIMDFYGPVDYRSASAHSLYFAHVGIKMMHDRINKDKIDRINTLRHAIHALQDLTDSGKIVFYPDRDSAREHSIDLIQDIRFIPAYETAVTRSEEELKAAEQGDDKPYQAGHENFLLKAFVLYYLEGNEKLALEYRDKAQRLYGDMQHNQRTRRYLLPTKDLFRMELGSLIENMESLRAFLYAMTVRAMQGLLSNDAKAVARAMQLAKEAYDDYMKTPEATTLTETDRMALVPEALLANNIIVYLRQPMAVELKAKLWRNLPLKVRQSMWDVLNVRLKADAETAGLDPAKAFPEPADMDAYRKANPRGLAPPPKAPEPPKGTGSAPLREK